MVFSAIQGGKEIIRPIVLPSITDDLSTCLATLRSGFEQIRASLTETPAAISFAFPGPADYEAGIIGDLPNFPAFRGGVPLGPYLEEYFGIPVFINNDGNLFAYGEALAGILPEINLQLQNAGNPKRYKNLIGVTLGTGFGGGIVINGKLLIGDNQLANSLWCQPNICHPEWIAEESVSIRGIQRIYAQLSGDSTFYSPKEIFEIAENSRQGDNEAAIAAFSELGKVAGQVLASALLLIDGIVVIGGGVAGAAKYILPALINELKGEKINQIMPIKIMLLTGLRIGEMCGLRWEDIDLQNKLLHVRRNRLYHRNHGIYIRMYKNTQACLYFLIRSANLPFRSIW